MKFIADKNGIYCYSGVDFLKNYLATMVKNLHNLKIYIRFP